MKKSEMTVTMPLTSYKQIESLLNDYENLKSSLRNCIDTSHVDSNISNVIIFKEKEMMRICSDYLPIKYANCSIKVEN